MVYEVTRYMLAETRHGFQPLKWLLCSLISLLSISFVRGISLSCINSSKSNCNSSKYLLLVILTKECNTVLVHILMQDWWNRFPWQRLLRKHLGDFNWLIKFNFICFCTMVVGLIFNLLWILWPLFSYYGGKCDQNWCLLAHFMCWLRWTKLTRTLDKLGDKSGAAQMHSNMNKYERWNFGGS